MFSYQESSSKEITQLKQDLEDTTTKLSAATSEVAHLRRERIFNSSLHLEVAYLRKNLESERATSATLRVCLEKERSEKDSALLRNAQVSQDIEIVKQENQQNEIENLELQNRIESLEHNLQSKTKEMEQAIETLEKTKQRMSELEEIERNKEKIERNEKLLKYSLMDREEQLNEKTKVNLRKVKVKKGNIHRILIIVFLDNQNLATTVNRYEKNPPTRVESSIIVVR